MERFYKTLMILTIIIISLICIILDSIKTDVQNLENRIEQLELGGIG